METPISLKSIKHVYFLGIGGISMSALALILKKRGIDTAGYDAKPQESTRLLEQEGISVDYIYCKDRFFRGVTVVYTAAIAQNDPNLLRARELSLPVLTRAQLLGLIASDYRHSIGVAGTHGKSTTTGMLWEILSADGGDPSVIGGAVIPSLGAAFHCGTGPRLVFEACEYKRSFLDMEPSIKLVLNCEHDHIDCYPTLNDVVEAFHAYIDTPRRNGQENRALVNRDCQNAYRASLGCRSDVRYFSICETADYHADHIDLSTGYGAFDFYIGGAFACHIQLKVPGLHNVANAVAAGGAAHMAGAAPDSIQKGLEQFTGIKRRFEHKGTVNGALVIDDYAHHPDEIRATLKAAKLLPHKRLICLFQPHTYSRTKGFLHDFSDALSLADKVLLADIYAAREKNTFGISSRDLAALIPGAEYCDSMDSLVNRAKALAKGGDIVLTLGAGDIYRAAEAIAQRLGA